MHEIENTITLDEESPIFRFKIKDGELELEAKNELDSYILSCGKSLGAVTSSMNKARLSLALLDAKYLDSIMDAEQSKSIYIEMLIENSIIRVQSIYDRTLIFTNKILNLGISNDSINHTLIVTNDHVKRFDLVNKLKAINKTCNEYRQIRNTVIHHDRYSEDLHDQLTMVLNADHLSKEAGRESFVDSEELGEIIQSYLEDKKQELEKYLDSIEQKLFNFFDSVLPIYHYQKKLLRRLNKI
ncbi:hypothetical protein DO021_15160 [Desulfobacter hydrogenophilus]|uniref:Cthe-2314-like HEPN domain-containing protein n=1 Tax=Desulfobacter hydrogenophilus TaxID=2291 RepID=A0A328F964_9BACT|nr:Cthe_2314 family HEPN domain-containing protein [Desulfobacter hydrogenophilus]NDY72839.1 hypothetical protein [Desulfobacter hydrogenophilus]QBH13627.1 hypothetical protein EYB58_12245 [Desulfobacter hydrogenophilus]RAM01148.1 hypothetical protein DO021_15160 [Desulfobacter hydrogenophilus]